MTATFLLPVPGPSQASSDLARLLIDHETPAYDAALVPDGQKYVVLCDKIGGKPIFAGTGSEQVITKVLAAREKGDVVGIDDLGGKEEVCRLLMRTRPFLRAATAFEATQQRVTIEDNARAPALEELLAEERKKTAAAVSQLDQAAAENAKLRSLMIGPRDANPQATAQLVAQQNAQIEQQRRQIETLREELTRAAEQPKAEPGKSNGGRR